VVPETQYARLGDLHLAYQVLGAGPPDVLLLDQWFSHQDAQWEVPPLADFRERLATFSRLILFDKRGSGLSDPIPTSALPGIDAYVSDIPAVLDAVGSERPVVIANLGGGILATTFAAHHPDRLSMLVLVDCFARFTAAPDFPVGWPPERVDQTLAEAEQTMGRGLMIDLFAPSVAGDERVRRAWSRYERQAASPGNTIATVRLIYGSDVRALLPQIRVPTLVIHRAEAREFPVAHGRYLAAQIPGSTYVELPGADNLIWAGDQDAILAEIQAFVTGVRPAPAPHRVLATVLFTDIVGSTQRAAELGDQRWRALLDEHFRVSRRAIERFGGREVKTTGDGFLVLFPSPARAVRGAAAMIDAATAYGLTARAAVHAGEVELQGDEVRGIAVHSAARILGVAQPGEVLVSTTIRDLLSGSGLAFSDRGEFQLRGLEGRRRLAALLR